MLKNPHSALVAECGFLLFADEGVGHQAPLDRTTSSLLTVISSLSCLDRPHETP